MSAEGKDRIEALYQKKFSTYKVESSSGEWAAISGKVTAMNFTRFSWLHFNLYYLIAILVILGTSALIFFSHNSSTSNNSPEKTLFENSNQPFVNEDQTPEEKGNPKSINEETTTTIPGDFEVEKFSKSEKSTEEKRTDSKSEEFHTASPAEKSAEPSQKDEDDALGSTPAVKSESKEYTEPDIETIETPTEEKQIVPIVKQVVVIQQDTVYEYDTVKLPKRPRRK